ncbi:hypothetical protein EBU71_06380 [bacterium]|jgi:hypothetical protein|nr:hypothetical protein [Candidatus Elulimicrobium humile]
MDYKHNKKRNIGLISEFFSRYIAEAFIDGRNEDVLRARKLWEKHVHPKSAIYEELHTFNALYESNLKSRELAFSLLERAKIICKNQSQKQLDEEKNNLISEIGLVLGDKKFFERTIPEYKSYASIQVLMNAWRGIGFKGTLSEMVQLEEMILEHVLTPKSQLLFDASQITTTEVDNLVIKLMTEKFNAKYNGLLNEAQKQIVNLYMLEHNNQDNQLRLVNLLEKLKTETLKLMKSKVILEALDKNNSNNLDKVITLLENSDLNKINDETVTFYMSIAKLKEEMENRV